MKGDIKEGVTVSGLADNACVVRSMSSKVHRIGRIGCYISMVVSVL